MSKIIATTKRLILREIEADDQDLVFKLSLESSALSHLATDDVFLELYREVSWKEINLPSTFNALMFLKETVDFVGKIFQYNSLSYQMILNTKPTIRFNLTKITYEKAPIRRWVLS